MWIFKHASMLHVTSLTQQNCFDWLGRLMGDWLLAHEILSLQDWQAAHFYW